MENAAPACPNCRAVLPAALGSRDQFAPCPACGARLWLETFPALVRPLRRGTSGEAVLVPGEATCFYHETKKAEAVCDACGRFLCGLCDCVLHGRHYCPNCLQAGKRHPVLKNMDNVRPLYGRQAFVLSLVPFYVTGVIAVIMALRYRKEPGSLVAPKRWMFPAALVLGLLQTIGFTLLIILAIYG